MNDDHERAADGGAGEGLDSRLAAVFDGAIPPAEAETWAAMPQARREMALRRIAALDRYVLAKGKLPARTAAIDAGLKLPRFYQMVRAWRDRRSLASVGAYAVAPRTRERFDPVVVNALQGAVVSVVRDHPEASVAAQTRLLAHSCDSWGGALPRHSTLRVFVERERARIAEQGLVGTEILFDCSLSSIPVAGDDAFFTVFLALDRASGLILGAAVGDAADSEAGYRAAAAAALAFLRGPLAASAAWSPRFLRSQLVPGEDVDAIGRLVERIRDFAGGLAPQLLAAGRYGAYARTRLGLKIGPIQLLPARTGKRRVPTPEAMAAAATYARDRLGLEVAEHNRTVLGGSRPTGSGTPPPNLKSMLEAMASI